MHQSILRFSASFYAKENTNPFNLLGMLERKKKNPFIFLGTLAGLTIKLM